MNIHHNARLTFRGRELLVKRIVEQGLRVEEAAQASGVSVRTAYKWSGVIAKKALRVSTGRVGSRLPDNVGQPARAALRD